MAHISIRSHWTLKVSKVSGVTKAKTKGDSYEKADCIDLQKSITFGLSCPEDPMATILGFEFSTSWNVPGNY
jgi:hypothetical protein